MVVSLVGAYGVVALAVGTLAYYVGNPYGHLNQREAFKQAAWIGAFWLPLLFYAVSVLVVETIAERLKSD